MDDNSPKQEQTDKQMPSSTYRLIKLVNGEDIMCSVITEAGGLLMVKQPMKMTLLQQGHNETSYGLSKWLPFTDQEYIAIIGTSIVTIVEMNREAIKFYHSCLEEIQNRAMEQGDDGSDEEEEPQKCAHKVWVN